MVKKVILALVVLGFLAGGFLYWWNSQADVRELNKDFPEGVRVVKSLFGEDYKVVNKIDGYSFKVPREWGGLEVIEYVPERTEGGYTATSIGAKGNKGAGIILSVDRYKLEGDMGNIKSWAETNFETFGLVGNFNEDKMGEFDIVKTQENVHLGGMLV